MWRKFTLAFAALLTITLGAFSVYAQSNAGAGNQGSTSNRPKIEIIKKDITAFKDTQITEITANAGQINLLAENIMDDIRRIKLLLDSYTSPPENDPYVVSVMRQGGTSQCEAVSCADNQKLHWDGSTWRCLNAVLPTCGSGTVFSTVTCSCINPCEPGVFQDPWNGTIEYTRVPDREGTCCPPRRISQQSGLCQPCPEGAYWDPLLETCRCPNGAAPDGGCAENPCPVGQIQDNAGNCCVGSTMVGGYCPLACPTFGHTRDGNGVCCAPGDMTNGLCPAACPAGTTTVGNQCRCPGGEMISPNESCTVCPSGQLPDNNAQCCPIENLEFGQAGNACTGGGSLTCSATAISDCNLPEYNINPNQTAVVNGVCSAGMQPDGAASCYATCQAGASSANYASPNVGCVAGCPPHLVPSVGPGLPPCVCPGFGNEECNGACYVRCPIGQSRNGQTCQCEISSCSGANENPTPVNGQCTCNSGFERVNDQCVAVCGANQVRNSSGQCVCVPNYEMVNGQCMPVCESNMVRNGAGVCACPSNLPHWYNNRCYPCPQPSIGSTMVCRRCMPNGNQYSPSFCMLMNAEGTSALCECMTYPPCPGSGPNNMNCTCGGAIESEGAQFYSCVNGAWQQN